MVDIQAGIITAVIIAVVFFLVSVFSGVQSILAGKEIKFFKIRRDRIMRGWRLILLGIFWILLGFGVFFYGEPIAYNFITPSPTLPITNTPLIPSTSTLTPTTTLTPTITLTPAESYTPTATETPRMPLAVEGKFEGILTPPAEAVFSPLEFTNIGLDEEYQAIGPGVNFSNPVGHMYAVYSYANMADDVQWTAIWYRDGELIHFETSPWVGGTGGYDFTDWNPNPEMWLPGSYQVIIFLGSEWQISGTFTVEGNPPTPTSTVSPTATASPSPEPTSTLTPSPTVENSGS